MSETPVMQTAFVKLTTPYGTAELKIEAPTAPTRLIHMLPLFHQAADAVAEIGTKLAEVEGRKVSCKAGCGACCRQMVPITKLEARRLREMVEAMPEPRQSQVRARFADARRRFEADDLPARIDAARGTGRENVQQVSLEYFRLGIPCPFLENESCSIHAERPAVCREYLVTSDPELCRDPSGNTLLGVKVAPKISLAMHRFFWDGLEGDPPWVPLILSLDAPPVGDAERPGTYWVNDLLNFMSGKKVEPPDLPGMQGG